MLGYWKFPKPLDLSTSKGWIIHDDGSSGLQPLDFQVKFLTIDLYILFPCLEKKVCTWDCTIGYAKHSLHRNQRQYSLDIFKSYHKSKYMKVLKKETAHMLQLFPVTRVLEISSELLLLWALLQCYKQVMVHLKANKQMAERKTTEKLGMVSRKSTSKYRTQDSLRELFGCNFFLLPEFMSDGDSCHQGITICCW